MHRSRKHVPRISSINNSSIITASSIRLHSTSELTSLAHHFVSYEQKSGLAWRCSQTRTPERSSSTSSTRMVLSSSKLAVKRCSSSVSEIRFLLLLPRGLVDFAASRLDCCCSCRCFCDCSAVARDSDLATASSFPARTL